MFKMGSHDPFGHFKHKLWLKEGPGVKLAIWFPTTKSQESPQLPYVQVVCNMLLKNFQRRLQLYFKPPLNQSYAHKVIGPQSRESLNFENFETPTWESRDKMTFGCWSRG
jgi:hypothetical protein